LTKIFSFAVEKAEMYDEEPDSQFATARIQAFNTGRSLHNTLCDLDTLKRTAPSLYEKPIIWEYDSRLGDFGTHNPNKTVPAGFIVPNSADYVELEDGRFALTVFAKIWKKYSGKFLEIFRNTGTKNKSVSVEMEVYDYKDEADGAISLLDFAYSAVCVLGDYVTEASPGANIDMLSFSKEKHEYEQAYLEEFASRYDELDFKIPEKVKQNAQEGLDLYSKHKKGGTSVALSVARFLVKNEKGNPEKIKNISKYFNIHSSENFDNKSGKEWIGWQLRGGNEGKIWSSKLEQAMAKIDERKTSFFAQEGESMPYQKIEDINPALKGITPPISLGQANAIAKQADAVGSDDKKNGWAIAISSFKKTHKVVDGKWVEKNKEESMAEEVKEPEKKEEMAIPEEGKPMPAVMDAAVEKKDEPETKEEEKDEGKEEFSFAQFSNLASYMAEEDGEDEESEKVKMAAEELKKEKGKDFAKVVGGMYAKMCKMSAKLAQMAKDAETKDEEMSALKSFKAGIEEQQKQFAVEQTLVEMEERVIIPAEARTAMIEDAKNYSFADIDAWKNACKAKSFDFALKNKEKADDSKKIVRIGLPFSITPKTKSLWTVGK
jgi:hypothetical protein